ncbi:MAG: outer membrane beta-barrel protein [Terracidiphilus sp.]
MFLKVNRILQSMAGTTLAVALMASAQTPAPAPDSAPAAAPAAPAAQAPATPPAPPAPPTWSVGPMDLSGFIDGYYSFNANRPNTQDGYDQINQLYNFNDKTDQFELSAAKLTLNHDPDPVGAHVDFVYGRTNDLINAAPSNANTLGGGNQLNYLEQAFISMKPPKAKGFELDFGKFVTSAGAEVIEAKDNWNYSRSLLFVEAIPYWHFGVRTSMPVSKTETIGVQVVNGWNNVSKTNGGATIGLTSALTKTKYTWDLNYYVGPENANTTSGFRNLIDTTLLLTPNAKFNAYINYDYGQNRDGTYTVGSGDGSYTAGDTLLKHWQGVGFAAHGQATGTQALTGRFEYFNDPNGSQTGLAQHLYEFTATYEYKWAAGLLTRVEYRGDFSNVAYFDKDANQTSDSQNTITIAFIAFFGPKR